METNDRWVNRRRMAWASLIAGLGYPCLAFFTDSQLLVDLSMAFYTFATAVVGSYIGFATMDDKWNNNASDKTSRNDSL